MKYSIFWARSAILTNDARVSFLVYTSQRPGSKQNPGLQSDIAKDQARYIKHVLRQSLQTDAGATNIKAHLPARIGAAYAEVDKLSEEKIQLASRLVGLLARAQARLDADVVQVRALHGESTDEICELTIVTEDTSRLKVFGKPLCQRH